VVSVSGNVTANNGMFTTIVNTASHTGGIVSVTGNITANTGSFFIGNGSQLTGIVSTYGNANVVANLALLGSNPVSTTGNVTGGNILTGGLISTTANVTANNGMFTTIVNTASFTGGIVSVTGNITGNNAAVTALSVTGNTATITSANYSIGYLNLPQIPLSANTTTSALDSGKHYYSTSVSNITLTIANNTSVSWVTGTAISLVSLGSGNITVAGASGVSLYLAGNTSAGNRILTTYGLATLLNVSANTWIISGVGLV
jgi:filamentous hemagglutinin